MEIRTVALIGLGALGVTFGQRLDACLPKGDFVVIADEARAARYRRTGVRCNGQLCDFVYADPAEGRPADLVIVATKSLELARAMDQMAAFVGPDTVLLSLLNGITSEEELEARWPGQALLCVALRTDATRVGQDVTFTAPGVLQIGERDGSDSPRLAAVAALLDRAGIAREVYPDMVYRQWNKLMINVGLNQATAVYDVPYGGVYAPGEAFDTMVAAMREVVAVSRAAGVCLAPDAPEQWIEATRNAFDPAAMPSMRQDTLAHRPTEKELFSGAIRRLGRQYGVPTPVNDWLYAELCRIEASWG